MRHEDILSQVIQNNQSQHRDIRDYCDGQAYKSNPLFREHPNASQIELYYDDFTPANTIGAHSRHNKISAVYFILGNLLPCKDQGI